jgi:hypothetical protein
MILQCKYGNIMGEAAPQFIQPEEIDLAPEGAFFNSAPEENPCDWQNFEFAYSDQNVFGDGLPTSPQARLRNVVKAIREVAPLAVAELGNDTVVEAKMKMNDFLRGHTKLDGKGVRRDTLTDIRVPIADIWLGSLAPVNHPAVQIWRDIYKKNELRVQERKLHPTSETSFLTTKELDSLATDLVLVLKPIEVRKFYNELAAQERARLKSDGV